MCQAAQMAAMPGFQAGLEAGIAQACTPGLVHVCMLHLYMHSAHAKYTCIVPMPMPMPMPVPMPTPTPMPMPMHMPMPVPT